MKNTLWLLVSIATTTLVLAVCSATDGNEAKTPVQAPPTVRVSVPQQAPPVGCSCYLGGKCDCTNCTCPAPAVARGCQAIPLRWNNQWWCQAAGSWWVWSGGQWRRHSTPAVATATYWIRPTTATFSGAYGGAANCGPGG